MIDTDKIQIELIKLAGGERLFRLSEPLSGLVLEKKLDPQQPAAARKVKLIGAFEAALSRFFTQLKQSPGDYTRERHQWLRDKSVRSVAARIRARKKARV